MLKIEKAEDFEIEISQQILDELMRTLEVLESSTDLEGSAIVSKTGLRIASSEATEVEWDIYSASPATLISLGEKISQGLKQGELKDIVIKGTTGYTIILVGDADNDFMLFTRCKKSYKLGYYFHKIRKAFREMEPVLKQVQTKKVSY
ncbi:MAG: roadblock/LC7 domain-containing protein [Candidatus Lokiarchaeota archaeon]|nr:roadblock/LC7 domain-containing protein [Candidatus Lokiarchaeota archaeon]